MQESCKCGQNKIRTETDGKFAYQICDNCKDIINIICLSSIDVYVDKDEQEINDLDEELLGLW